MLQGADRALAWPAAKRGNQAEDGQGDAGRIRFLAFMPLVYGTPVAPGRFFPTPRETSTGSDGESFVRKFRILVRKFTFHALQKQVFVRKFHFFAQKIEFSYGNLVFSHNEKLFSYENLLLRPCKENSRTEILNSRAKKQN